LIYVFTYLNYVTPMLNGFFNFLFKYKSSERFSLAGLFT
jgi:hypothetical protein